MYKSLSAGVIAVFFAVASCPAGAQTVTQLSASAIRKSTYLLPYGTSTFVVQAPELEILRTGTVTNQQDIVAVPYSYRKTFRLKTDLMSPGLFGGKPRVDLPAGSLGFYGAAFQSHGLTQRMLCVFRPEDSDDYKHARCFLRVDNAPNLQINDLGVLGNLETSYMVSKKYGIEQANLRDQLDIEDGDFVIPHDFKLTLRVKTWKKGAPVLSWEVPFNNLRDVVMKPGPDGRFVLQVNGGRLVLQPDPSSKQNTIVSFEPPAP